MTYGVKAKRGNKVDRSIWEDRFLGSDRVREYRYPGKKLQVVMIYLRGVLKLYAYLPVF